MTTKSTFIVAAIAALLGSATARAADKAPSYTFPQDGAAARRMHASYKRTALRFGTIFTAPQRAVMEQVGLLRGDAGMSKAETPFVTSFRIGKRGDQPVATFRVRSYVRTDPGAYYPQKVKQADLMWAKGSQVVTLPITPAQQQALASGPTTIWRPLGPGNRFQANWQAVSPELWPPMQ